ncbi:uncharacterized protein [Montipora foliosa]|uniref:uncharacterized protein n=1 Tax=Montipora foliosa TaxID=591990 RepID=UPI0035F10680
MFLHPRKRILRYIACCALFSIVMFPTLLYFGSNDFSVTLKRLLMETTQPGASDGLLPQIRFTHLQPLVDMFASLSQVTPSKRDCMFETVEFSDLKELETKEAVFLVITLNTAPSRNERREAVRQTWWKKCGGEVVCKFFTDGLQLTREDKAILANEKHAYKDIEYQPIAGGRNFGLRYLYQMMWAAAKYNFTYFLHLDDDYFVCLERLKTELRYRPTKMLTWGWYHCVTNLIRMDEAWTLFSHDVVTRLLSQDPQQILCHPHAGLQVGGWIHSVFNKSDNLIYFDDRRLHHAPRARKVKMFENLTNACDSFMGIHGGSPEMMLRFSKYANDNAKKVTVLTEVSQTCDKPFVLDLSKAGQFDLRPCVQNPQWTPGELMWKGVDFGTKKGSLPCP